VIRSATVLTDGSEWPGRMSRYGEAFALVGLQIPSATSRSRRHRETHRAEFST
jgi:hypothetical protein